MFLFQFCILPIIGAEIENDKLQFQMRFLLQLSSSPNDLTVFARETESLWDWEVIRLVGCQCQEIERQS